MKLQPNRFYKEKSLCLLFCYHTMKPLSVKLVYSLKIHKQYLSLHVAMHHQDNQI